VRVSGTILGVIDNKGTYAPVYRYTLANGQTHEAKSDTSSSAVEGKETGRIVPLLISAHNPSSAREANGYLLEIIGIILIAPGLLFGTIAVTSYPVTPMTWLIGAAILVYLAYRGWRVFIPKNAHPSLDEWRRQRGLDAAIDLTQVRPIESIASAGAARQRDQAEGQRARKWAPVIGIFAVVLAAVAIYQSITLAHLESAGVRAPGRIVRLKEEWGSGSSGSRYTYYPIVRFHTHDNLAVEFKDNIGSNPPTHRVGDNVTVLYLVDNPQSGAIIDRGLVWNWAIPSALFLGAAGVAMLLIVVLRRPKGRPSSL
jgi:hypothetical protein